jgi:hypothetical protein
VWHGFSVGLARSSQAALGLKTFLMPSAAPINPTEDNQLVCTVTGFFGGSIRFRTNESVVNELLLLKARARKEQGQIAVFFVDDNFAINIKRTKSLLRDIIVAKAQVFWVAQISANLLRDEELVDLIAASGGKWISIGMESIDPVNLRLGVCNIDQTHIWEPSRVAVRTKTHRAALLPTFEPLRLKERCWPTPDP